ncbi:hypothetical protein PDO_1180 [Rhizobium sp. PDO1-076]|uniref:hypothetical protein n=1 Tax=Rhizobium sp. PDO1-076 TaxID=1125979 RepID=UPI00024E3E20|nr:hypothetical protein [Rhizobium sp. PDO1-076]EHS53217.1 hypothetical protein PDO_1180 [Rhizobium sp. PDO1-076]
MAKQNVITALESEALINRLELQKTQEADVNNPYRHLEEEWPCLSQKDGKPQSCHGSYPSLRPPRRASLDSRDVFRLKAQMSNTLWKPEPSGLIHQTLGKASEETSEPASILSRCIIQGLNQGEPADGKPNRRALSDEIDDFDAAVQWLRELTMDEFNKERSARKVRKFHQWPRMVEEDVAMVLPDQCDAWSTAGHGAITDFPPRPHTGNEGGGADMTSAPADELAATDASPCYKAERVDLVICCGETSYSGTGFDCNAYFVTANSRIAVGIACPDASVRAILIWDLQSQGTVA